jgi:transposase InsO family protein
VSALEQNCQLGIPDEIKIYILLAAVMASPNASAFAATITLILSLKNLSFLEVANRLVQAELQNKHETENINVFNDKNGKPKRNSHDTSKPGSHIFTRLSLEDCKKRDCYSWRDHGVCRRGDNCHFKHDPFFKDNPKKSKKPSEAEEEKKHSTAGEATPPRSKRKSKAPKCSICSMVESKCEGHFVSTKKAEESTQVCQVEEEVAQVFKEELGVDDFPPEFGEELAGATSKVSPKHYKKLMSVVNFNNLKSLLIHISVASMVVLGMGVLTYLAVYYLVQLLPVMVFNVAVVLLYVTPCCLNHILPACILYVVCSSCLHFCKLVVCTLFQYIVFALSLTSFLIRSVIIAAFNPTYIDLHVHVTPILLSAACSHSLLALAHVHTLLVVIAYAVVAVACAAANAAVHAAAAAAAATAGAAAGAAVPAAVVAVSLVAATCLTVCTVFLLALYVDIVGYTLSSFKKFSKRVDCLHESVFVSRDHDCDLYKGSSEWILDGGTTSHTINDSKYFVPGSVREQLVTVTGALSRKTLKTLRGTVVLHSKNVESKEPNSSNIVVLEDVLFTPESKLNLISEGRLQQVGCRIVIENTGSRFVLDGDGRVLVSGAWPGKAKHELVHVSVLGAENCSSCNTSSISLLAESYTEGVAYADLLHRRHGHASLQYLKKLYPELEKTQKLSFCEACHLAKASKRPNKGTHEDEDAFLDRVDSDLTGPFPKESFGYKKRYYAAILDVKTRFCWIYFLRHKSGFTQKFKEWLNLVKTKFQKVCKVFHTDWGGEFENQELNELMKKEGIEHKCSAPHLSGRHNPFVERKHRSIKEAARTMRILAGLPMQFWQEAASYACYLQNRLPHKKLDYKTPYEAVTGKVPDMKYIKTFGCAAYPHNPDGPKEGKSEKCMFLGVDPKGSGYRLYSFKRQSIIIRGHCTFNETIFPWRKEEGSQPASSPFPVLTEFLTLPVLPTSSNTADHREASSGAHSSAEEGSSPEATTQESAVDGLVHHQPTEQLSDSPGTVLQSPPTTSSRRSARQAWRSSYEASTKLPDIDTSPTKVTGENTQTETKANTFVSSELDPKSHHQKPMLDQVNSDSHASPSSEFEHSYTFEIDERGEPIEPSHLPQAQASKHWPEWRRAMQLEYDALVEKGTFTHTPKQQVLDAGKKPLPCMWVFKVKRERGKITKFKARLTVKGCNQIKGVNYEETFAAVAQLKSFRILFALAALLFLRPTQIDISNAFLNGKLEEEIYMHHPPLFKPNGHTLLKLDKSLYGLKQAPRVWWKEITKSLKSLGFKPLITDSCVFVHTKSLFFIVMHVDDLVMLTNDERLRTQVEDRLANLFSLTKAGRASVYLGIEIDYSDNSVKLSQRAYIETLLKRFNLANCHTSYDMPAAASAKLHINNDDKPASDFPYRSLIGGLLYLAIATRPDIAYIVNALAQYSTKFTAKHVSAGKRVLRYLARTAGWGVKVVGSNSKNNDSKSSITNSISVTAYCDSDWAGDEESRRSRTGYIVYVGDTPVSWRSVSQRTVALSSCEAEFYALADVVKELLWLKQFLTELGLAVDGPIKVFIDNQAAQALAENPVSHQRTKHIDIRYFFLREHVAAGTIQLAYINTLENPADLFTKSVEKPVFEKLVPSLVSE